MSLEEEEEVPMAEASTRTEPEGVQGDRDRFVDEFQTDYPELAAALELFEIGDAAYKEAVDSWLGPTTTQVANSGNR
jgi:hypothetical protein